MQNPSGAYSPSGMHIQLRKRIRESLLHFLANSPLPEELAHATNVWQWVKRLYPRADFALEIAALGHDIERAIPGKKIRHSDFSTYDGFKQAHAENSAKVMLAFLAQFPVERSFVEKVIRLVRYHEFGKAGDAEVGALKDADSLSFFEINLPYFLRREGSEVTFRRMRWGYKRLSPAARQYLAALHFPDPVLRKLMNNLAVWAKKQDTGSPAHRPF